MLKEPSKVSSSLRTLPFRLLWRKSSTFGLKSTLFINISKGLMKSWPWLWFVLDLNFRSPPKTRFLMKRKKNRRMIFTAWLRTQRKCTEWSTLQSFILPTATPYSKEYWISVLRNSTSRTLTIAEEKKKSRALSRRNSSSPVLGLTPSSRSTDRRR